MTRQRLAGRLVEAGCCLLVFVATLEACVRLEAAYRWGAPFWGAWSMDDLRSSGADGYFNRPGGRFEKWRINASGFRGPEIAVEKPSGVVRVGVVGASEVFGLYESPGEEVTAQLQQTLDATRPRRFEVVNLAAAGMSPPRMREFFEQRARAFGLDVVVVYPTPALYLDVEPPRRQPPVGATAPPTPRDSLRVLSQAWRMARERLPSPLQDMLKRLTIERERRPHGPGWVWDSTPADRLALFEEDTAAVLDAVRGSGARAILATHATRFGPSLDDQDRRMLLGWNRFYPRATTRCLLDMERKANGVLRRIGGEMDIPVTDIEKTMGGQSRYFADFSHFTDEGAQRAAGAMAREVLALPPAGVPARDRR